MKFLGDMGISPKSKEFLQALGYDAVHLLDQGLERLPDSEIMEKALTEGRIVLTHDLGFGDLLAASGERLPSVIIFRLQNMKPQNVNRYLQAIISQYSNELEQGVVVSVTEARIRVRDLPLSKSQ
jgi:predicted nuclease of predicted toxin-antitoxin system